MSKLDDFTTTSVNTLPTAIRCGQRRDHVTQLQIRMDMCKGGWSMPPIPTPEVQEESHDALGAPKGLG